MRKKQFDSSINKKNDAKTKVGCVFPMVIVSILPYAEFGRTDHREDASHFNMSKSMNKRRLKTIIYTKFLKLRLKITNI